MKHRNWFWGTLFLISAVVFFASQVGWLDYKIGAFTIIATVALIAILVQSLIGKSIFGSVYSLALLLIVYEKPLGFSTLDPFSVLIAATLLWIGLAILFSPRHHHPHGDDYWNVGETGEDQIIEDATDADHLSVSVHMTQGVRYIQATNMSYADIAVSMGGAKVYFDDVEIPSNEATIHLDVSLGNLELYVPQNWKIINQVDTSLSGMDDTGSPVVNDGPTVYLTGRVHLGGLSIIYV